MAEMKNLGCTTSVSVISQSSSSRKLTYVRKFNPDMYTKN